MLFALGRTLLQGVLWFDIATNDYLDTKTFHAQHSQQKNEMCRLDLFALMEKLRWFDEGMRELVRYQFEGKNGWELYLDLLLNTVYVLVFVKPSLTTKDATRENHTKWMTKCKYFSIDKVQRLR